MASSYNPLVCKESFLQKNPLFSEVELNDESKPIGKLDQFDLEENEIWIMQCPKEMNISELETQKLKLPGRSNVNGREAVSVEFNEGKEQHAFAYCNRKGQYALRLLPLRGTIIIRDRLKAAEVVTEERAEEYCPPAKRVPLPANIRVRHPLLGVQYEDKTDLDKSIDERLQKADQISAQMLKERLNKKIELNLNGAFEKTNVGKSNIVSLVELNTADEDDVEFISEVKLKKKKKNKRKHSDNKAEIQDLDGSRKTKKSEKIQLNEKDIVSKDLQWLQKI